MVSFDQILEELTAQFPGMTFFVTRRLTGRCIVAKKSKYCGADIFVKKNRIVVEASIPEWKTRFMLGAGAAYRKLTDPNFNEAALQVAQFLSNKYEVRLRS